MNNEERTLFWNTLTSLKGDDVEADVKRLESTIRYPDFIYRYRAVTVKNIDALQHNKLYFSRSSYYDDPFDTYIHINYKSIWEQLYKTQDFKNNVIKVIEEWCLNNGINKQIIKNQIEQIQSSSEQQLFDKLREFLTKSIQPLIRNTSFSICFSESGLNESMWLKYADQYKGYCLMFSLTDEEKYLCGKQEKCQGCGVNRFGINLYPMYYSTTRYDATKYAYNLSRENLLRKIYPIMPLEEIHKQLDPCVWERERVTLIKSKCHEYDNEWRIVLPCEMREPIMMEWVPYGVILGLNMSDNDKRIVINSAKRVGIEHIYKSIIDNDGRLDAIELTKDNYA